MEFGLAFSWPQVALKRGSLKMGSLRLLLLGPYAKRSLRTSLNTHTHTQWLALCPVLLSLSVA